MIRPAANFSIAVIVAVVLFSSTALARAHEIPQLSAAGDARAGIVKLTTQSGDPDLSTQPIDQAVTLGIKVFVEHTLLKGDLRRATHLQSIYAGEVDYSDKGHVPVSTVIADKLAYAKKWPTIVYELRPDSISIERVGNANSYIVQFEYNFRVSNQSDEISGIAKSELVLGKSKSGMRITSEKGLWPHRGSCA
jgi:hypothetical protein